MNDDDNKCPNVGSCALFPLISQPGYLRVWQINYCEADFASCERYKRSSSGEDVPLTLMPNGRIIPNLGKGKTEAK